MSPEQPPTGSSQRIVIYAPLIVAAYTPAPKPLSTLTTATLGAHEASIESSAASPPVETP